MDGDIEKVDEVLKRWNYRNHDINKTDEVILLLLLMGIALDLSIDSPITNPP